MPNFAKYPLPHLLGRVTCQGKHRFNSDGDTVHLRKPVLLIDGKAVQPKNKRFEVWVAGATKPRIITLKGTDEAYVPIRFEGIDAPEQHYRAMPFTLKTPPGRKKIAFDPAREHDDSRGTFEKSPSPPSGETSAASLTTARTTRRCSGAPAEPVRRARFAAPVVGPATTSTTGGGFTRAARARVSPVRPVKRLHTGERHTSLDCRGHCMHIPAAMSPTEYQRRRSTTRVAANAARRRTSECF